HHGLFLAKPCGSGSAVRNCPLIGDPDGGISRARIGPSRSVARPNGGPDRCPGPEQRVTGGRNRSRGTLVVCFDRWPAGPIRTWAGRTSCEHRGDPGAKTHESPILYWITSTRPWLRPSPAWP